MLFVFKMPKTAPEAQIALDNLAEQAVTIMMPDNRRRLGQRRNTLNAHYDQISLTANLHANKGDKAWEAVAERVTEDKKILSGVKDMMQTEGVQLW
tara:strand:- start:110 stop:397 length:288 start_codon:yes stop_codon:yes gene_type:complete